MARTAAPPAPLALEPRFMFDGAAVATLHHFDGGEPEPATAAPADPSRANGPADEAALAALVSSLDALQAARALEGPGTAETTEGPEPPETPEAPEAGRPGAPASATGLEYVFVDARVARITDLAAELAAALPADARVIVLDPASDGVEQMAAVLAGARDVSAVHLLSHGEAGRVRVGGVDLDAASIQGVHAAALAAIGAALAPDADLLIYGCNFAAGPGGDQTLVALAAATGADVAASVDPTGAARLGGDWVLERAVGPIEARGLELASYDALLAEPVSRPVLELNGRPPVIREILAWQHDGNSVSPVWLQSFVASGGPETPGPGLSLSFPATSTATVNGVDSATYADAVLAGDYLSYRFTTNGTVPPGMVLNQVYFGQNQIGNADFTVSIAISDNGFATSTWMVRDLRVEPPPSPGGPTLAVPAYALQADTEYEIRAYLYDRQGTTIEWDDFRPSYAINAPADLLTQTENDWPIGLVGPAATIEHLDSATLASASATLIDAETGDALLVDGSAATSGVLPSGIAWTRGDSRVDFSGSASHADYLMALQMVQFQHSGEAPSAGTRIVSFEVSDGFSSSAPAEVLVMVTAVNDAPVHAVPAPVATAEGSAVAIPGLSVADPDSAALTTTLAVSHGTVTVATGSGATLTGNQTATVTLSGTASQINTALAGLSYRPTNHYSGSDALVVTTSDGELDDSDTVALTVTPVPTPPRIGYDFDNNEILYANGGPGFPTTALTYEATVALDGGVATPIRTLFSYAAPGSANEFGVYYADNSLIEVWINDHRYTVPFTPDAEPHTVLVVWDSALTSNQLKVYFDGQLLGQFTGAAGTFLRTPLTAGGMVTMTQDQDALNVNFDINQSLVGDLYTTRLWSSALSDSEIAARFRGEGSVLANVLDVDFTRLDNTTVYSRAGTSIASLGRGTVTFPSTTVPLTATLEDQPTIGLGLDRTLVDRDGSETLHTTVSGVPVGAILSDGAHSFTATVGNTSVDVSTWDLEHTTLLPELNRDSNVTLTVTATARETATGATASTVSLVTLMITPVNDAPAGTSSARSGFEDAYYYLSADDFGYSDPVEGHAMAGVVITTLPANGSLRLNGIAIPAGTYVTAAQLANGELVWRPPANANGAGLGSFTFQVRDAGGTANGGIDTDPTPNTLSFTLAAVNDDPVNTLPASFLTDEDTARTLTGLSIADIDAGSGTMTVTLTVASGQLAATTGGGVTVTGSGTTTLTLSGTLTAINTLLGAAATAPVFTPLANFSGNVSLTLHTSDGGNTGIGGALTDFDMAIITVVPVADAPRIGYDFDTDEVLYATNVNSFPTTALSFEATLALDSGYVGPLRTLFSYAVPGSPNEFAVFYGSGDELRVWVNDSSRVVTFTPGAEPRTVLVVWDSTLASQQLRIYVDGQLLGTHTDGPGGALTTALTAGGIITVGQDQDSPGGDFDVVQALGGDLYATRLWSTALTPAQVAAQFQNGAAPLADVLDIDFTRISNTTVYSRSGTSIASLSRGTVVFPSTIVPLAATPEDQATIGLGLDRSLVDRDGSETLQTTISGIPVGAVLSDGTHSFTASAGNTSVDVSAWDLEHTTLLPEPNRDTDVTLTLTATAYEFANGTTASTVSLITLMISPVNDAPVNTLPARFAGLEDTALSLTGLAVADVDAGAGTMTVTLTVASGRLTASSGGGVTASGSGTTTLTLSGTLGAINSQLSNAATVPVFTPAANFSGNVSLTMTSSDGGNSGAGGVMVDTDVVTISIAATDRRPSLVLDSAAATEIGTLVAWTHNQTPPSLDPTIQRPAYVASAGAEAGGPGLTLVPSAPGTTRAILGGIEATSYAEAWQNDEYVAYTFTTPADLPAGVLLDRYSLNLLPAIQLTILVDTNASFSAPTLLHATQTHVYTPGTYSFDFSDPLLLEASTTYYFRVYLNSSAEANPIWDDFSLRARQTTVGHTVAYTENGAAANVASPTLANADDRGENDLVSLTVQASGLVDGSAELITIGGYTFNAATSTTQTRTVGGTAMSVSFDAALQHFTITRAGGGLLPEADVDTLVRGITYRHSSDAPTAGARTLAFQLADQGGHASAIVRSTINVSAVNDAPVNTVPAAWATAQGSALTLGGLAVHDVDAGNQPITVSLQVSQGQLTASSSGGVTVTGSGSALLTLNGSQAALNAYLAGSSAPVFTAPALFSGTVSLTMTSQDGGHSGSGGALTDVDVIGIAVAPLQYRPTLVTSNTSGLDHGPVVVWAHNGGVGDVSPSVSLTAYIATAGNEAIGPGLTQTFGTTTSQLHSVDATNFAEAWQNGEYVSYQFTTTGTVPAGLYLTRFRLFSPNDFGVAILVDTDPAFGAPTVVQAPRTIVGEASVTNYFFVSTPLLLEASTTYYVRAYVYDAAMVAWDDFGFHARQYAIEHTATYVENGSAVNLAHPTQANAGDGGEADLQSLTIQASGFSDGTAEILTLGGQAFNAATSSTQTITVGTTSMQVVFDTGLQRFTITRAGGGILPETALDQLLRGMTYRNSSENPGTGPRSLAFQLTDLSGHTSVVVRSHLTVTAVDDAPVIAVPGAQTTPEDQPLALPGISVSDVDSTSLSTVVAVGHGRLSVDASGAAVVTGNGSASVSVSGTPAQINAALAGLIYRPTADYSGADTLTVTTSDSSQSVNRTVALTVQPVVDAPLIGYHFTGNEVLYASNVTGFPTTALTFEASVAVSDGGVPLRTLFSYAVPGSDNEFTVFYQNGNAISVSVNSATRVLPLAVGTDLHRLVVVWDSTRAVNQLSIYADGVLVGEIDKTDMPQLATALTPGGFIALGQDQDAVNASYDANQALRGSLYSTRLWSTALTATQVGDLFANRTVPAANVLDVDFTAVSNTTVSSRSGTSITSLTRGTVTFPSTVVPLAATLEDQPSLALSLDPTLVDRDGSETLQTTVSGIPVGAVLSDGSHSFMATAGNTTVDVSTWNLAATTLLPELNRDSSVTLTVTTTARETATGATASTVSLVTLMVTPVNDAPAGTSSARSGTEDTPYVLAAADFGYSDPVEGHAMAGVVITTLPADGVLRLNGSAVTAGSYVTVAQLAAGQLVWTPAAQANGAGLGSFTFQVRDAGGTADGGSDTDPTPNTLSFTLAAVNDAPVNTLPAAFATSEETALSLTGLSVADVDAGSGTITVTLAVGSGTLAATSGDGVTVTGSATATLTLSGTLAAINARLGAAATAPLFTPDSNFHGAVSLTMTTSDGGNSGSGGALTDVDTATITVAPHEHLPSLWLDGGAAPSVSVLVYWSHNTTPFVADYLNPAYISSAGPQQAGAGLTQTAGLTWSRLTGVDATSYAQAWRDAEYTAYQFTTAASLPAGLQIDRFSLYDPNGFNVAILVDTDPAFSAPIVLQAPMAVPVGEATVRYPLSDPLLLTASTTYHVRAYVFGSSGSLHWDDFAFHGRIAPANRTVTFVEDGPAVNVANPTLAHAEDGGDGDLLSLSIQAGGFVDGSAEEISIGGQAFNAASSATQVLTVGGTSMSVSFDAALQRFTITRAGGGVLPEADLDALIRSITYRNLSDTPATTARELAFQLSDQNGHSSVVVRAVINVTASNDAPINTLPASFAGLEDTPLRLDGLAIADPDAASGTMTVTLTVDSGRLSGASGGGVTVTGSGSPTLTLSGSLGAINTLLGSPATAPVHTPAADFSGTATLTMTTSDGGNSGVGGARTATSHATLLIPPYDRRPSIVLDSTSSTYIGGLAAWNHNQDPSSFEADFLRPSHVASAGAETAGPGLTLTLFPPHTANSTRAAVSGIEATNFAEAWQNGEYIAYQITTVADLPAGVLLDRYSLNLPPAVHVTVLASTDPAFASPTLIHATQHQAAAPGTPHQLLSDPLLLEASTTYYLRFYLHSPDLTTSFWDDFALRATQTTVGHTVTYVENGAAVNVASSFLADADDRGENDLASLGIQATGLVDGSAERITIGGYAFNAASSTTQSLTVGSTAMTVAFDAALQRFTITRAGGGVLPEADLDTLVRGITYRNLSEAPATTARSLSFQLTDQAGHGSAIVSSIINVTAVNDAPVNALPPSWTTNEDSSVALTGLAVTDVDAGSGTMTVVLAVSGGLLSATSGDGVTVTGSGSTTLTLSGTLAAINTRLGTAATAPLFTPLANFSGAVTLTMTTSDGGHTGSGGSLTDVDTATIFVAAYDHRPSIVLDAPAGTDLGYLVSWRHNQSPPSLEADHILAGYLSHVADEAPGPGLTLVPNGAGVTNAILGGIDATRYSQAWRDGEYVAYQFTTAADLPADVVIDRYGLTTPPTIQLTILVDTDPAFSSPTLLRSTQALTYIPGARIYGLSAPLALEASTTYYFRVYLDSAEAASPRWDDFAFLARVASADHAVSFTENAAAVNVASPTLANAGDSGEDDLASLTIEASGLVDGSAEEITIGGYTFNAASSSTQTLTVGGTAMTVAFDSALQRFTITHSGGGVLAEGDLDTLIRGISYRNSSEAPATTARSLSFQLTDQSGHASAIARSLITVTAVNDAPVNTMPAAWTTNEDTAVTLGGLAIADVDAGSGTLTVTLVAGSGRLTAAAGGGVTVAGSTTGTLTLTGTLSALNTYLAGPSAPLYIPVANANGPVNLTMTTHDGGNTGSGGARTDVDLRVIHILPVEDPPAARHDSLRGQENTAVVGNVLANDVDVDGEPVFVVDYTVQGVTEVAGASHLIAGVGTVSIGTDGAVAFTPLADYNGTVPAISYRIRDAAGNLASASLTISVMPVADPVTAQADHWTLLEDGSLAATGATGLLANDPLPFDATRAVTGHTDPAHGSLSVSADGSFVYTPDADFAGVDSFDYTVTVRQPQWLDIAHTGTDADGQALAYGSADPRWALTSKPTGATVTASATALTSAWVTADSDSAWIGAIGETLSGSYVYTTEFTVPAGADLATARIAMTVSVDNAVTDVRLNGVSLGLGTFGSFSTQTTIDLSGAQLAALATGNNTLAFVVSNHPGANPVYGGATGLLVDDIRATVDVLSTTTATASFTVQPVNDAPVNSLPASFTTDEDTPLRLGGISIADSDDAGLPVTVVLGVSSGSLEAASQGGVVVSGGGSASLTLVGSLDAINSLLAGAGAPQFIPAADAFGTVTLTLTSNDGGQGGQGGALGDVDTAVITVNPVNDGPTQALPAGLTAVEDTTTPVPGITVADIDSASLTTTVTVTNGTVAVPAASPALVAGNGSATLTLQGSAAAINAALADLTFTGRPDYNGAASITVSTSDGLAAAVVGSVAVTVTPVADAADDTVTTVEDTPVTFNVLSGSGGASADSFTDPLAAVTAVSQPPPGQGTVVFSADGTITYTPAPDFFGSTRFSYTVTSGGVQETGTVDVIVTPVNDAPTQVLPGQLTTSEDSPLDVHGVQVSDIDSAHLTTTLEVSHGVADVGTASGATVVGNGTDTIVLSGSAGQINAALTSLTFRATPDYHGPASITIRTDDGDAAPVTATIAITVTPVDDIEADTIQAIEDTPISFNVLTGTNGATADSFENPDARVTAVTQPPAGEGSVSFDPDGTLTYTPYPDFHGTTWFTYTVTAGGTSESTVVTINVDSTYDPPHQVVPGPQTTTEDRTVTISGITVGNVDGQPLVTTLAVSHGVLGVTAGTGATVTGEGSDTLTVAGTVSAINAALAALQFTPAADFNGAATLVVSTTDGLSAPVVDTIAITVIASADIVADTVQTAEDTPIHFNVMTGTNGASADSFDDPLAHISAVTQPPPGEGSVSFDADGTLHFVPAPDFHGWTSFTYTVTAGGTTETAVVNVHVSPVNDPPINQVPASRGGQEDLAFAIPGLSVVDIDSPGLTTTLAVDHGRLDLAADGGAAVTGAGTASVTITGTAAQINAALAGLTYTGMADYHGDDAITMTTSDGSAAPVVSSIALVIAGVTDATDDSLTTTENSPVVFNVLTGTGGATADGFSNADARLTAVSQPGSDQGRVDFDADGTITFTPAPHFHGSVDFTYTVTSGGVTETARVQVAVTAVDDPPGLTLPGPQIVAEDTATPLPGLAVIEVDGDSLTVVLAFDHGRGRVLATGAVGVTGNDSGRLTVSGQAAAVNATLASLVYTGPADYAGPDRLEIQASDGITTAVGQVGITVTPVADIVDDHPVGRQGEAMRFNILTGEGGAAADRFSGSPELSALSQPTLAEGQIHYSADGWIRFEPAEGFSGRVELAYAITSGGTVETGVLTIEIVATPPLPVIEVPPSLALREDEPVGVPGLRIAGDAAGPLTVTVAASHGDLTLADARGLVVFGNGTAQLTLAGEADEITAALASIQFRPAPDFHGGASIHVTARNGDGGEASASLALSIAAVADLSPGRIPAEAGTGIRVNPLTGSVGLPAATFADPAARLIAVDGLMPDQGQLSFDPSGEIRLVISPAYRGEILLSYTVSAGGSTEQSSLQIQVVAPTPAPGPAPGPEPGPTPDEAGGPPWASPRPVNRSPLEDSSPVQGETLTARAIPFPIDHRPLPAVLTGTPDDRASLEVSRPLIDAVETLRPLGSLPFLQVRGPLLDAIRDIGERERYDDALRARVGFLPQDASEDRLEDRLIMRWEERRRLALAGAGNGAVDPALDATVAPGPVLAHEPDRNPDHEPDQEPDREPGSEPALDPAREPAAEPTDAPAGAGAGAAPDVGRG